MWDTSQNDPVTKLQRSLDSFSNIDRSKVDASTLESDTVIELQIGWKMDKIWKQGNEGSGFDYKGLTKGFCMCESHVLPAFFINKNVKDVGYTGNLLLIYICNFHVLSNLLLIHICKLHWKMLNTASYKCLCKHWRVLN